jgi:hypothetical protein
VYVESVSLLDGGYSVRTDADSRSTDALAWAVRR